MKFLCFLIGHKYKQIKMGFWLIRHCQRCTKRQRYIPIRPNGFDVSYWEDC
jgi:hypothetical protein